MWTDLFGTWSGVLSVMIIVICALAIPGAVMVALHRQFKGPAELSHMPQAPAAPASRR